MLKTRLKKKLVINVHCYAYPLHSQAMKSIKSFINILNVQTFLPLFYVCPVWRTEEESISTAIGVAVPSHSLTNSSAVTHAADYSEQSLM